MGYTFNTCSVYNVAKDPDLITNIRDYKEKESLTIYTNQGVQSYTQLINLILFPLELHLKEDLMANILSLKSVVDIKGSRNTMDTSICTSITVALKDGMISNNSTTDLITWILTHMYVVIKLRI